MIELLICLIVPSFIIVGIIWFFYPSHIFNRKKKSTRVSQL